MGILRSFRRWLDWKMNHRYYEHVPERIRRLGEASGAPKPNRYVPSAQGLPVEVTRSGDNEQMS